MTSRVLLTFGGSPLDGKGDSTETSVVWCMVTLMDSCVMALSKYFVFNSFRMLRLVRSEFVYTTRKYSIETLVKTSVFMPWAYNVQVGN